MKEFFAIIRSGKSPLNGQVCAENKPSALKQKMRTCRRQRQRATSSRGLTQGVRRDERGMGEGGKSGCRGRLHRGNSCRVQSRTCSVRSMSTDLALKEK